MPSLKSRTLHDARVIVIEDVTPRMRRITVAGSDIKTMPVDRPAMWMKLFFPMLSNTKPQGRVYAVVPETTGKLELAVQQAALPKACQIILTGKAVMVRSMRTHLLVDRSILKTSIDSGGYWRLGNLDSRQMIERADRQESAETVRRFSKR